MATFTSRETKDGTRWKAEVVRLGVRKSKTFTSKRRAELWAAEIEAEILTGARRSTEARATLHEVLGRYAREKSPLKRGCRWEEIRLKKMQRDIKFVGTQVADVTSDMIGKLRDSMLADGLKPDSVRRELGLLSAVFDTARKEWGLMRVNPCQDVTLPEAAKPRTRRLSDDEATAICTALGYDGGPVTTKSQEVAVAILVAIETAMRCGEILSLEREQTDFENRVAHLLRTKNGDEREVPLSTRAVKLLQSLPGQHKLFTLAPGSLDSLFRRAYQKAGVKGLHFHDTRREGTTRLAKIFGPMELARITGHRDLNLLLRVYYRPQVSSLVAKLS